MIDSLITRRLVMAFPGAFINSSLEFIAHRKANSYFRLEDCMNETDVKCKLFEWMSRDAHKTSPFHSRIKNEEFNSFILNGINSFLGTDFTKEDMAVIYQKLGNRVNHNLTLEFVESGYDMKRLNWEG